MTRLRILLDGEWVEVDADAVEVVPDEAALGEVVDGEVVGPKVLWAYPPAERPLDESQRRREQLRAEAAWIDE